MAADEVYVPPGALVQAKAVLYGDKRGDAAFCQLVEGYYTARVWREAIRQAIAAPEQPRHAVSGQSSLFGTPQ